MKKKSQVILTLIIILLSNISVFSQVKFPEYLENADPTKFLVDQEQLKGTHWSVINEAARDAIPENKREIGMLVTWIQDALYVTKRYQGANVLDANWTDNTNWRLIPDSVNVRDYIGGAIVDSVDFNAVNKIGSHHEGTLFYDSTERTLVYQNDIVGFNHNLGYELVCRAYNNTVDTIFDGQVVRLTGGYKSGNLITTTIDIAGNGSSDSTTVIGMATVTIPPSQYGIVTLRGEVKGLNTSVLSVGNVYLGSGGTLIDTIPPPPNWAVSVGTVYYADNDSGRVFVDPGIAKYSPNPHYFADTTKWNYTLLLSTNVYAKIPISASILYDSEGFTEVGDSIKILQDGHYEVIFNSSYTGNIQNDVWRIGVFVNGVHINSVSRSTSSTAVGNSTVIAYKECFTNDYISVKMKNESADRDPVINDMSLLIQYVHE